MIESPKLIEIAARFAAGGCCGRQPKVLLTDIVALGLTPIPQVFESSLGPIVPLLGWNELCVWVHEALVGPFPAEQRKDPGDIVAAQLRAMAETQ